MARFFLLITMLLVSGVSYSQDPKIVNKKFPDNWDANRDLRHKNGKVLAWAHYRLDRNTRSKSCLLLVCGSDSSGSINYYISVMYTNKKPYNKWYTGWTHYLPDRSDSCSGLNIGYFDMHLKRFDHKPTEIELNNLLSKWDFSLTSISVKLIEAGIDEELWFDTFGFIPDKKMLTRE
jgi:hypothetical protein